MSEKSPPKISADGRFYLDDGHWRPLPTQQARPAFRATSPWVVMLGVLLAAVILWVIYTAVQAKQDNDCVVDNADRALAGEPLKDCG